MYKVVKLFTDLKDNNHLYKVGDCFPRKGLNVSEERIKELLSSNNKQNTALIVEVKEEVKEEIKEEVLDEKLEEPTVEVAKPKKKSKKK